jgi:uncharacterized membrane protein
VLYETLKFVHIVAAVVVVGGAVLLTVLLGVAVLRKDPHGVLTINATNSWVGNRFFAPGWLLLLGFGIWTVVEGDLSFGDAWITIGFVVFAVSFVLGPTVHDRHAKQLRSAIEADGPTSARALGVGRRELTISVLELCLLIFAIWAMTAKPGF